MFFSFPLFTATVVIPASDWVVGLGMGVRYLFGLMRI